MEQNPGHNLVALFNSGNQRAFQGLYKLLYPSILVLADNMLSDTQEAQDVCTESFIKLFQSNEKFESLQNLKAFLFTITRNACLNSIKSKATSSRNKKQLSYLLNDKEEIWKDEVEAELINMIYASIENLPGKCRNVFRMTLLGYSPEEIAERYKISISTVRNQKARGLKLIRKSIMKEKDVYRTIAAISVLITLFSQKPYN